VALVRTDVSEELSASETPVLTKATLRNNPEDTILHSHHRENLKSYNEDLPSTKVQRTLYSLLIDPYCPKRKGSCAKA
jgi:hypothetical protein